MRHLRDEADAAFLYRALSACEPDSGKAELYSKLAAVEDRHIGIWKKLLEES